jgi:hypothetical protein
VLHPSEEEAQEESHSSQEPLQLPWEKPGKYALSYFQLFQKHCVIGVFLMSQKPLFFLKESKIGLFLQAILQV